MEAREVSNKDTISPPAPTPTSAPTSPYSKISTIPTTTTMTTETKHDGKRKVGGDGKSTRLPSSEKEASPGPNTEDSPYSSSLSSSNSRKVARTFSNTTTTTTHVTSGEVLGAKPDQSTSDKDPYDDESDDDERPAKKHKRDSNGGEEEQGRKGNRYGSASASASSSSSGEDDTAEHIKNAGAGEEDEDEEEEDEEEEEGEEREEGELNGEEAEAAITITKTNENEDLNPPLPPGPPPEEADDGWQAIWDDQHQAYYFYNGITGASTWTNPRAPPPSLPAFEPSSSLAPGVVASEAALTDLTGPSSYPPTGSDIGSIYDTTTAVYEDGASAGTDADQGYAPTYYQLAHGITDPTKLTAEDLANTMYQSTGTFNRFTGKFQTGKNPEMFNDENKSRRQMEFYFDVDAAANSHDGRSLKAERQMKKLSKKELKAFREKRKEKKEQKRRAWLKD